MGQWRFWAKMPKNGGFCAFAQKLAGPYGAFWGVDRFGRKRPKRCAPTDSCGVFRVFAHLAQKHRSSGKSRKRGHARPGNLRLTFWSLGRLQNRSGPRRPGTLRPGNRRLTFWSPEGLQNRPWPFGARTARMHRFAGAPAPQRGRSLPVASKPRPRGPGLSAFTDSRRPRLPRIRSLPGTMDDYQVSGGLGRPPETTLRGGPRPAQPVSRSIRPD